MSFERLYQIAISQDKAALDAYVAEGGDVYVRNPERYTVGSLLATEGKETAARFLLDKDATRPLEVARGAAQGGHQTWAETLRQEHELDINELTFNAGYGNQVAYAGVLITAGALPLKVAMGAAQAGHQALAETLRQEHELDINELAFHASLGNQSAYANFLITAGALPSWVAQGAAKAGHQALAETLRLAHSIDINELAFAAGSGNQSAYADELIKAGALPLWVAEGAAKAGHQDLAEVLRSAHSLDINKLAFQTGFGNQSTYANFLITADALPLWVAQGAAKAGHQALAETLRLAYSIDINKLAFSAGYGNQSAYAYVLIKAGALPLKVAQGAAKAGHQDLAEVLRSAHSLDINKLAFQTGFGNQSTYANFLITAGALPSRVAGGAAQAGHQALAEKLLRAHSIDINKLAFQAGYGNQSAYADVLIKAGAPPLRVAQGAAKAGNQALAETLRQEHELDINELAFQAGFGNQSAYANFLITADALPLWVARGAAQAGHQALAEKLLLAHSIDINELAFAAGSGNQSAYADELIKAGAGPFKVAMGAMKAGHHDLVKKLCLAHSAAASSAAPTPAVAESRADSTKPLLRQLVDGQEKLRAQAEVAKAEQASLRAQVEAASADQTKLIEVVAGLSTQVQALRAALAAGASASALTAEGSNGSAGVGHQLSAEGSGAASAPTSQSRKRSVHNADGVSAALTNLGILSNPEESSANKSARSHLGQTAGKSGALGNSSLPS